MGRSDVDDSPPFIGEHRRERKPCRMKGRREIDGENGVPFLRRKILDLDPFTLSEVIDQKLWAIQKLLAKGPAPKPQYHPAWGRRRISELGSPAGIPSSTLGFSGLADNAPLPQLANNLRKERFLQTA